MFTGYPKIEEIVAGFESITYEKFLAMKVEWLKNIHLTWLIQGHLSQESALKMIDTAESALNYQKMSKNDINYRRLVKLNDRTVYNLELTN